MSNSLQHWGAESQKEGVGLQGGGKALEALRDITWTIVKKWTNTGIHLDIRTETKKMIFLTSAESWFSQ